MLGDIHNITQRDLQLAANQSHLNDLHKLFLMLDGIIGSIISIIGILGNIINIFIFARLLQTNKSAVTCFLLAISVSDLAVVLIYALYAMLCLVTPPTPMIELTDITEEQAGSFVYAFYHLWEILANFLVTQSSWLTVSVMVFRFIAVYYPLKAAIWCTIFRARCLIVAIVVGSFLIHVPMWFTLRIETIPQYNVYLFVDTDLARNRAYHYLYLVAIIEGLNSFIPFTVCLALSIMLIYTLKARRMSLISITVNRVSRLERRLGEQRRISVTLIAVAMIYIICTIPSFIWRSTKYVMQDKNREQWQRMRAIADIFQILNHSVNFVIYILSNNRYRTKLHETLFCHSSEKFETNRSMALSIKTSKFSIRAGSSAQNSPRLSKKVTRPKRILGKSQPDDSISMSSKLQRSSAYFSSEADVSLKSSSNAGNG
ncbi:FMRFamide peptide receptor frpr-18-like [Watersipora subatra]|uniref:FMRFamide peptide receptor frpr-18-like n=1 Tax=Watersipora subatra TaxID=2589382 RepID=UPI00355BF40D